MLTKAAAITLAPVGFDEAPSFDKPRCPKCGNTGYYIGADELGREVAHRCQDCAKDRLAKGTGGIPAHYAGATWATWVHRVEVAELVTRLRTWQGIPWGMVLISEGRANLGAGKTRMLCTVVAEWRNVGRRARYLAVAEMIARQRAWMDEKTERDEMTVPWCSEYGGLLALDDLGSEHDDRAGFHASLVEEIMDSRFRNELPTLVATNLDRRALAERYPRAWRRLREEGEALPWSCPSYLGGRS